MSYIILELATQEEVAPPLVKDTDWSAGDGSFLPSDQHSQAVCPFPRHLPYNYEAAGVQQDSENVAARNRGIVDTGIDGRLAALPTTVVAWKRTKTKTKKEKVSIQCMVNGAFSPGNVQ